VVSKSREQRYFSIVFLNAVSKSLMTIRLFLETLGEVILSFGRLEIHKRRWRGKRCLPL